MNTLWSDFIQGTNTLYSSRALRFRDRLMPRYRALFSLPEDAPLRLLEVGCGPGALCGALARWYPLARITGLDRDSAFIAYARAHEPGAEYLTGDATALPFPDESFDATISNTVSEHVEPTAFFGEQRRVLRRGGKCIVISTRRGPSAQAECLALSPEETVFWEKAERLPDPHAGEICRYPLSEAQLPAKLEEMGFTHVRSGYVLLELTPDDPGTSPEEARALIESGRLGALDAVASTLRTFPEAFSSSEADAVLRRVQERFDRRLALYERGEAQWDTSVSILQVVTGVKAD